MCKFQICQTHGTLQSWCVIHSTLQSLSILCFQLPIKPFHSRKVSVALAPVEAVRVVWPASCSHGLLHKMSQVFAIEKVKVKCLSCLNNTCCLTPVLHSHQLWSKKMLAFQLRQVKSNNPLRTLFWHQSFRMLQPALFQAALVRLLSACGTSPESRRALMDYETLTASSLEDKTRH